MAIISIFSSLYCQEKEIISKLASKLEYEIIDEKLIQETSERYKIPTEKLQATLDGQISFFNNLTNERAKNAAYLKFVLAELLKKNNVIHHGYASHLLPSTIGHILRVCLINSLENKIRFAMEQNHLREREARTLIRKDEERRLKWTQFLLKQSPWEESLYDLFIPVNKCSINEAVSLILQNIQKEAVQTTADSEKALEDFILAARVNIVMVENGYNVDILSDDGKIKVLLKEYVIRLGHMKDKLSEIGKAIPGVNEFEVVMDPNVPMPSRYDKLEAPPRFLLVDDEKEYVQTLSDRLQTRDVESAVAYDGEEALAYIEKDEPDVMVLDLKMPGVNGIDVLRKVKRERPHVEVIILTGHGSENDRALAMELGAFAYLEKPVDIEVLTKKMKEAYAKIGNRQA